MFSLHIDTARTWRGGQNQVLLTVNGLRAIGHRAALVAHPDGELRRRAAEGLELIPIAPRTEMDLVGGVAASRASSSGCSRTSIHAHDPHGVAMASLALSLGAAPAPGGRRRRWSRRAASTFTCKGNSFSRWKHRQVDCFIAASEAIRQMLVADGVPPERTRHRARGHRRRARASRRRRSTCTRRSGCRISAPVVGNVAALVPHKGQRHLIEAAHLVVQQMPDARFVILGEGELREHARAPGARAPPREARAAARVPHRRPRLHQGLRPVRDELGHRRARHVAARRDGLRDGRSSPRAPAAFPKSSRTASTGCSCRRAITQRMAQAIVRLLARRRRGVSGWATPASRACSERFTVERMVAETAAVYARVAGRRHAADTARHACARLKPHAFIMPEVAEREVVLTGSAGSSCAQRRGDVARHPPARARVPRQPQAAADANHVGVERHDQLRRRHARPDAEIERVAPHHPAQKQIQPLAARCPPTAAERSSRRPGRCAAAPAVRRRQVERHRARRKSCRAPSPTSAAAGS